MIEDAARLVILFGLFYLAVRFVVLFVREFIWTGNHDTHDSQSA